jgi:hypothetical protein
MSGDYSRVVWDPAHDYDGVLLQQGRPLLDSDWNDLVAQANRRAQATSYDTFGGVAVVPMTTPDGFKLTLAGTQFTIGRGRIYVDGILAENHALPAPAWNSGIAWDAALAELYGTNPVPYDQQPYLPNPPALPAGGGPYLVYVDVWQREVNQFEAPDIVDKAVGVDSTTRLQTVWQVKTLGNDQGTSLACDTDLTTFPGWAALTAPSAGRLSTGTASFGTDNPCLIPPAGGYTGLENQLYRVEIHDGGAPGTATFKWSRDNASVETRVSAFPDANTLVVESVGKDGVLRFNDGDWIEILDDWIELSSEPQLPGELHRIVLGGGVDDATRTITLETPVTAGRFNADPAANRHTRIRRWDQTGQVLRTDTSPPSVYTDLGAAASPGAIIVPPDGATTLALENGIVVSFDLFVPGGLFKSGDWWVFAARTADASVELLDHAPPRGIHHHYARLGIYTPGQPLVNCTQFWPPSFGGDSCACTICVSPEAHAQSAPSLQQAIDTVMAGGGGTVCLEVGDYTLRAPLQINGASSLSLRGQGQATRLLALTTAIAMSKSDDITLERFEIRSSAESTQTAFAAITIDTTQNLTVREVMVLIRNSGASNAAIALSGRLAGLSFCDNMISAPLGIVSAVAGAALQAGPVTLQSLRVEDNVFQCAASAVVLQLNADSQAPLRLLDNQVSQCNRFGMELLGTGLTDAGLEIAGNRLGVSGTGIACGVPGSRIERNDVIQAGTASGSSTSKLGFGIVVMAQHGDVKTPGEAHVIGNRVAGFSGAGIAVETGLGKLQIKQNQIDHCGNGIDVNDGTGALLLSIENNQISDIDADPKNANLTRLVGIGVSGARAVVIAGNSIVRVGLTGTSSNLTTAAVRVEGSDGIRIAGNELSDIGPSGLFSGTAAGIFAQAPIGDVIIDGNRIRRDSATMPADASIWFGIIVLGAVAQVVGGGQTQVVGGAIAPVSGAAVEALPQSLQRLAVGGKKTAKARAGAAAAAAAVTAAATIVGTRVSARGNQITARGGSFVVAIVAVPICDFSNNQSLRTATANALGNVTVVDIFLSAQTLVVGGNRVVGPKGASMSLHAPDGRYTVLGNITSGDILVPSAPLAAPWAPLNVLSP